MGYKRAMANDTGLERLVFFSDAVVAIAITLLVLEIKLPPLPEEATEAALRAALGHTLPHVLAYVSTFLLIGILWIGHHVKFRSVQHYDGKLLWLNLFFLMGVGFLPFTSGLSAEHHGPTAWQLHTGTLAFTSAASLALWAYALKAGLVDPALPADARRRGLVNTALIVGVFVLSGALSCVSMTLAHNAMWLALAPALFGRVKRAAELPPEPLTALAPEPVEPG